MLPSATGPRVTLPMRLLFVFLAVAAAAGLPPGCGTGGGPSADGWTDVESEADGPCVAGEGDEDDDGISDEAEGRCGAGGPVDTDRDGTPDYLDDDSDGDTIPDEVEAGPAAHVTGPADSDEDGTPDFRDADSDGNGIPDREEGAEDTDGDGFTDAADLDNDGDSVPDITEIGDDPAMPDDTDRDGAPDYMDIDSDNDLIADIQEANGDTDDDGTPDRLDPDSDGDGVIDSYEAGDGDLGTWPEDADDDGYPNFRDVDSDNDGLKDGWEVLQGLDPYAADTDGDEFDDLTEIGAGSDPTDPLSTPHTVGNFFFTVDYGEAPVPAEDDIVFRTAIRLADIFFLMDTTGSMGGEIDRLQQDLSTAIIPAVADVVEDVRYGLGAFDDYPVDPYGGEPPTYADRVFYLVQAMTASEVDIQSAVDALEVHYGGDCAESQVPALYAAATGSGYMPFLEPQLGCNFDAGEYGYPCFRRQAVPIVVLFTDAPFHNGPNSYGDYTGVTPRPVAYDETIVALRARHVKVLGIVSDGGCGGPVSEHATRLAQDTATVDAAGDPLVFSISGTGLGLGAEVIRALQRLTGNVPVDVSVTPRDDLLDGVDATVFIAEISPLEAGGVADPSDPSLVCVGGLAVGDTDGDTRPDVFEGIIPGTIVCFHITVAPNDSIEPTEEPQTFKAYLDILADGAALLDTRTVIFLVPPHIEGPGVLE
jgi:hypothetical protein